MWNPRWRQEGREPDYRFSLANERTFLAWIRTSMALLAGGVVLEQFATRLGPHGVLVTLAVGLAIASGLLATLAYVRWRANEIAMRHSQPLPSSLAIPIMSAAALVASAAIVALLVPR